jgi:hypothetical protein
MGTTRTALRTALRAALLDNTIPLLWSDVVLDQAIDEAVTAHSYLFPCPVAARYSLGPGQQVIHVVATDPAAAEDVPIPAGTINCDVIGIQRVEVPWKTVIPMDPGQSTDPAASGSNSYKQGWRLRGHNVMLTNPASGDEVGSYTARIEYLQTYNIPLDSPITVAWNGPDSDVPLLLLLARRFAYEALAEWQVRTQGASSTGWIGASGSVDLHIDVPRIIDSLERQIKRAIDARKTRALRSRTLDI